MLQECSGFSSHSASQPLGCKTSCNPDNFVVTIIIIIIGNMLSCQHLIERALATFLFEKNLQSLPHMSIDQKGTTANIGKTGNHAAMACVRRFAG
jgi:hypothetical protein